MEAPQIFLSRPGHPLASALENCPPFKKKNYLFIYGCAGSSLLYRLFSSCVNRGYFVLAVLRLLILMASLVAEHRLYLGHVGFSSCQMWAQYLQLPGSRAQAQ